MDSACCARLRPRRGRGHGLPGERQERQRVGGVRAAAPPRRFTAPSACSLIYLDNPYMYFHESLDLVACDSIQDDTTVQGATGT
eukprot:4650901-Pleurochrysis_carterae.AAC.1